MEELLAHCELFMLKLQDRNFWQHPALMSDRISKQCLLRLLRGAQYHMLSSEARIAQIQEKFQSTVQQGTIGFGSFGPSNRVNHISHEGGRHISIDTLMEWGKTA